MALPSDAEIVAEVFADTFELVTTNEAGVFPTGIVTAPDTDADF